MKSLAIERARNGLSYCERRIKIADLSVESINLLSKYRRAGLLNTLVSLLRIARPNLLPLQASERSSAHYSLDERVAHFRERFFRPCCTE